MFLHKDYKVQGHEPRAPRANKASKRESITRQCVVIREQTDSNRSCRPHSPQQPPTLRVYLNLRKPSSQSCWLAVQCTRGPPLPLNPTFPQGHPPRPHCLFDSRTGYVWGFVPGKNPARRDRTLTVRGPTILSYLGGQEKKREQREAKRK